MTLTEYLDQNNMTESEFGALIDRSQSAVNKLKNSKRRPDWETLDRIYKATKGEVTPNDFLPDAPSSTEAAA
jgi:transcriptional regulator with XRE-family HTH domain